MKLFGLFITDGDSQDFVLNNTVRLQLKSKLSNVNEQCEKIPLEPAALGCKRTLFAFNSSKSNINIL